MVNKGSLILAGVFVLYCCMLVVSITAVVQTQGILNRIRETNDELDRRNAQFDEIEINLSQLNTAMNTVELYAGISPDYEWREQELLGSVRLAEERLWAARQIIWEDRGYTPKGK